MSVGYYRIILIVALLLEGCALRPESSEQAKMIEIPKIDQTLNESGLDQNGQRPVVNWWHKFQNPELERLIVTALKDSPDIKLVAARVRQSQSVVDGQAAELYPTIQSNVNFSAQRFSANSTQAKLAGEHFRQVLINPMVLRYHLDLWGRDKAALQAAVGYALAAENEQADARLLLSIAVAKVYFDLVAAEKKLNIASKIVRCREQLLSLNRVLLDQGLVSIGSILNAEFALNFARQQVIANSAEMTFEQNRLAALAGKGADWGRSIVIADGKMPQVPRLPDDLPLHLLANRPDIQSKRLRVEAAAEQIKVAKTEFYPDVNLVSFAGLHSVSLTDVLLQGSSLAYAVGPSIEFPLFEGGRLRARLNYREAVYDEAVEAYNAQLLKAVQEVADALALWRESVARLGEQYQIIKAIKQTRKLSEVLYRQGLQDRIQLLQALCDEYSEYFSLASLESLRLKAAVTLIRALGGGLVAKTTE